MLIIFSVNDQKITHDLKGQLVAGSVDIVQAAFKFDSSWDELDKIVVFTSSACPKPVPVQFADEAFYIPKDVLKPGKLYVSVVGFGLDGRKKTTQKWDIMQAITVQKCGDGGDCDLLRYLAQGQVADGKVAKDEEVKDMLDTVFGKSEAPKPDPGGSDSNDKNVSEDDIATDKVILRENITLAGGYTQVGNLTKSQNGTATFQTKGKSVADILTEIFSKRLQPTITAQPSVTGFALNGAKAVEAGTQVAAASYGTAELNPGSYKYGPDTAVVASGWKVERITDKATTEVANAETASLAAGSDNNGGAGFVIGDAGGDAVASLKYKATATHGAGVTAKDNLGSDSNPAVAIAAGTKSKETAVYAPFRNYFYGATTEKPTLNSDYIRSLTKSGKAYAAGTLTINVPVGAQRVAIACIATAKGVTKVINETAMNADVTSTFVKSTVPVEGANGYSAKTYNVWIFEPAVAYGNAAVLKVTLG